MWAFLQKNFRWIAGGFLLTYFSSFGQTFIIASSVSEWRATFDLSHGQFSALFMVATVASALTLPFLGRLVDVMPEHRVISICVPILAAASLLAAYAPSIWVLMIALYLLRLFGQGMMVHIALTAIGKWFAARRGRAVSLVVIGHKVGEFSLPALFAAMTLGFGWQSSWVAASALLLVIALPLCVWAFRVPRQPMGEVERSAADRPSWTRAQVLKDPVFWMVLTGVLAPPLIGTTIFFHQDYLAELRGWGPTLFPSGIALLAVTNILVALVNGALIDRYGATSILPFFLIPLAAACFAISLAEDAMGLYLFMVLVGVSYGISSTLFGALWPEIYGTEHLGAIRSAIIPFMVLSTAVGPFVTGVLIDQGVSLPLQLQALGDYCLVTVAMMVFVSNALKTRIAKEKAALEAA